MSKTMLTLRVQEKELQAIRTRNALGLLDNPRATLNEPPKRIGQGKPGVPCRK